MTTDFDESPEFKRHIHNLLDDYSLQHCRRNYIAFTEDLVSEFLEDFKPVPLTDPYSIILPVDPYDTFSKLHSLLSLPPYEEIWQTTNDARLYLKKVMRRHDGKPKTERIVIDDSYGDSPTLEPIYPALTRSARLATKKLGLKEGLQPPGNYKELVGSKTITEVKVEPVQEPFVNIEDILQLKCEIEPQDVSAVRTLLRTTASTLRSQGASKNKYLDPTYLRSALPPEHIHEAPEKPFMPIFPRSRRPGRIAEPAAPFCPDFKSLVGNPSVGLKFVEVVDLDEDISRQNLVMVDGWETIRSSPPSTPSRRHSDDEDQLDQLYLPSSPDTELALVEEIEAAKMDSIQIPRSCQVGGSGVIKPHILHGKTFETFLKPLLLPSLQPGADVQRGINEDIHEGECHSSPGVASSLFGQPSSALEVVDKNDGKEKQAEDYDLDSELRKLYDGQHNFENFIMDEVIDDKQNMMMEVPDLPPPTKFPRKGLHVPKQFTDFVIPTNIKTKTDKNGILSSEKNDSRHPPHQFLKKVKGCQSLGIALSWVPFTTDKKLPSILEIVNVVDLYPKEDSEHAQVLGLLESVTPFDDSGIPDDIAARRGLEIEGEEKRNYCPLPIADDGYTIVMNRQERRRLAKLEGRDDPDGSSEAGNDFCAEEAHVRDSKKFATLETTLEDWPQNWDVQFGEEEGRRPKKRPRLDHVSVEVDKLADCYRLPDSPGVDTVMDFGHIDGQPLSDNLDTAAFDPVYSEEDKENWPPFSSSMSGIIDDGGPEANDYHRCLPQAHDSTYLEYAVRNGFLDDADVMHEEVGFEPLPFGSRPLAQSYVDISNCVAATAIGSQRDHLPVLTVPPVESQAQFTLFEPGIASRSLGIAAFAHLRARKVSMSVPTPVAPLPAPPSCPEENIEPRLSGPPPEILDPNTIRLPETINPVQSVHKYMASLDLIQKRSLVRALQSEECAIEVIERQDLGGVDLILDTNTAAIFFSLFSLPARCGAYVERVSRQSWNYTRVLVILEGYPEGLSKISKRQTLVDANRRTLSATSGIYAYTPPILKAIKKFRRDLHIAEACGSKRPKAVVHFAFADTVDEAALFTRLYGNQAEANDDTQGAIWAGRKWLGAEYLEDEEASLAAVAGMNNFSASIILCQISLQEFLNMSPEDRIENFGGYIDLEALVACNADLEARFSVIGHSSCTLSEGDLVSAL